MHARASLRFTPRSLALLLLSAGLSFHFSTAIASPRQIDAPAQKSSSSYSVLPPIESGELTIFPVVSKTGEKASNWSYLTLDEGLRTGEVIVTEAGRVSGLVRPRRGNALPIWPGDRVNSLVLINNSDRPLLLLAGEIVTGGKQDRVIGKDRIVPPHSDPIDLSVFCIEPGRWIEDSPVFGAAGKAGAGFMVQPTVRREAMAAQDQQRVWSAVGSAVNSMIVAAPSIMSEAPGVVAGPMMAPSHPLGTTSYARVMQQVAVGQKVEEASQSLLNDRHEILARLRQQHAVGVVVAVRGQILWADIFANSGLLEKYWTKLIRSYAAEALTSTRMDRQPLSEADAQQFLDSPRDGHETSEGESGIYRYSEIHRGGITTFVLESLLPGTGFEVHRSRMRVDSALQPFRFR
jgi:hypothetical protein